MRSTRSAPTRFTLPRIASLKKPKPRNAGVSATEQGRARAVIEELQARTEELEQERDQLSDGVEDMESLLQRFVRLLQSEPRDEVALKEHLDIVKDILAHRLRASR